MFDCHFKSSPKFDNEDEIAFVSNANLLVLFVIFRSILISMNYD